MSEQEKITNIRKALKSYKDFPKEGILFWDIFSLLSQPSITVDLLDLLKSRVQEHCPKVDVFVGLESRGFLFGLPLSTAFGKPFVPMRKKGKLPGATNKVSFSLEYGEDVFEIQTSSVTPGQTVVIVDDLLATGGTLRAANELIRNMGATVGLNLLCFELQDLHGRDKISTPVQSLLEL